MRLKGDDPGLLWKITPVLAGGGVGILPCDTIYGLVGIVPDTEERIRRIKGRAEEKPFLCLIPSASWLGRFTDMPLPRELESYWPGPLTLIFPSKSKEGREGIALRVPADRMLARLMDILDKPLYSTSVNFAGEPALWRIQDILSKFEALVDFVVDAGDLESRTPSTILDITRRPYRLVRRGAVELPDQLFSVD